MSISSTASQFKVDGCIVYENAVKYGDHYQIHTYPDGSMDVLWEGLVIDSDLPYCESPYPIIDSDAWERYESVNWFAQQGITHTPRVPHI